MKKRLIYTDHQAKSTAEGQIKSGVTIANEFLEEYEKLNLKQISDGTMLISFLQSPVDFIGQQIAEQTGLKLEPRFLAQYSTIPGIREVINMAERIKGHPSVMYACQAMPFVNGRLTATQKDIETFCKRFDFYTESDRDADVLSCLETFTGQIQRLNSLNVAWGAFKDLKISDFVSYDNEKITMKPQIYLKLVRQS